MGTRKREIISVVLSLIEKRLLSVDRKLHFAWNGEPGNDSSPLKSVYTDDCVKAIQEAIREVTWALRTLERLKKVISKRESLKAAEGNSGGHSNAEVQLLSAEE